MSLSAAIVLTLLSMWTCHVLLSRCIGHGVSRQALAVVAAIYGAGFGMIFLPTPFGLSCLLSLTMAHVYFHWFNMSETARRIRILMMLDESATPRRLNYSSDEMIEKRIQRLLKLGLAGKKEGNLFLKNRWAGALAKIFVGYERLMYPERKAS